jgi:predicted Zn-ribbon and HTH transcriptional regulator
MDGCQGAPAAASRHHGVGKAVMAQKRWAIKKCKMDLSSDRLNRRRNNIAGCLDTHCDRIYRDEGISMSHSSKKPPVPVEMHDTIRREIVAVLEQGPHSAKDLSIAVRIAEKEVYDHLEHIRKTMNATDHRLAVIPAECKKCGFVFSKRERLKKPGKCPVCRGESIYEPLFSIEDS